MVLKTGELDDSFIVKASEFSNNDQRKVMASVNGPCLMTPSGPAIRPMVDRDDPYSALCGAAVRFGNSVTSDRKTMLEFRAYVRSFVRKNFVPLSSETDLSFDTWIQSTGYSESRKAQLAQVYATFGEEMTGVPANVGAVKSFIKDERYNEYKHSRVINSRSDEYKVLVGPFCKAIEKVVFSHESFIKKVPVDDRPSYIKELLGSDGRFYVGDFTSFEGSFTKELMKSAEFELYVWMLSSLPDWMLDALCVMLHVNRISNRRWKILVLAKRMSGEMVTSLGNGFTNLMAWMFLVWKKGGSLKLVVEGDDCLANVRGCELEASDFQKLGLVCKIESHRDLNTTSFCGLLFDETAEDVITDPLKVLAEVGLASSRYYGCGRKMKMSLLRAKALSLAHQYPNCPIVRPLADKLLEVSKSYNVRQSVLDGLGVWRKEEFLSSTKSKLKPPDIKMASRVLMENIFGISVNEQIHIEKTLFVTEEVIFSPYLHHLIPNLWSGFADTYGTRTPTKVMTMTSRGNVLPQMDESHGFTPGVHHAE